MQFRPEELTCALKKLKALGLKLQDDGNGIVRIAEAGLSNATYVEGVFKAGEKLVLEKPSYQWVTIGLGASGHSITDQITFSVNEAAKGVAFFDTAISAAAEAVSASNVATQYYGQQIYRASEHPDSNIKEILAGGSLKRVFTEDQLDVLLDKFGQSLSARRKGAWQTFYSASSDALAQAAHTMRDILEKVISKNATNALVEPCPWYQTKKVSGERTKVTIDDRIRYLIYGTEEGTLDLQRLSMIEKAVREYVNDDGALKATAHGSESHSREETKQSMENIEELLFLVLHRWQGPSTAA